LTIRLLLTLFGASSQTIGDPTYADAILDRLVHNGNHLGAQRGRDQAPLRSRVSIGEAAAEGAGTGRLGPDTRAPVEDVSSERPVEGPHEPIRP
jgi:hypothetical protein